MKKKMLWTRETVTSLDNQRKATAFSLMYVLFLVVSGVIREQKQSHISGVTFNLMPCIKQLYSFRRCVRKQNYMYLEYVVVMLTLGSHFG
jgi:chloramphenicol O-acetyltransferase